MLLARGKAAGGKGGAARSADYLGGRDKIGPTCGSMHLSRERPMGVTSRGQSVSSGIWLAARVGNSIKIDLGQRSQGPLGATPLYV